MKPDTWSPKRYMTLVAVFALHVALIIALAMSSRTLRLALATKSPLELLFVPEQSTRNTEREQLLPNSVSRELMAPMSSPLAVTPSPPVAPTENSESPIDWAGQAEKAAKGAATPGPEIRGFDHQFPSESGPPPKSIFGEPVEHHAGEQFRTDDGKWVVYVSDNCYQMSDRLASINASGGGTGVQTYCKGRSNTPRGDLFDQLPAYKKYHPNH